MADDTSKRIITPAGMPDSKGLSRRTVLKGAAASVGLAAGSGAISGFPTIWAQNIKDVTLLQVGGSYSAIIDIARKATEDLGFKVEMQTADHAALLNRLVTQPESLDIADTEFFFLMYTVPRGIIQPVDLTKYKWWDKVVPIFTKGQYPDGREVSRQGINPYEVQYVEGPDARDFHDGPTDFATAIPTVYNADTLGIRPDLLGREMTSWAELLNPEFKGKHRSGRRAADRHHGRRHGDRGPRRHQVRRQGQHDPGGDRQDDRHPDRGQEERSIPGVLDHLRRVGQPDGLGRGGAAVDVVAGGHRGALARDRLLLRAAEGRLSRLGQLHRADGAPRGPQARRRLRIPQLVPVRLAGRLHRQAGLLHLGARDREAVHDRERVGLLVRGQAGAGGDQGPLRRRHGAARSGARRRLLRGAHGQRRLLEHADGREPLHDQRWNEFIAA